MANPNDNPKQVSRRSPKQVMRLSRLGSFHQSRLSFMRVLTRRLKAEQWQFKQKAFDIDSNGVGHAVYSAIGPERTYSLVAFAHDLPNELRSDRVIAEQWDTTFALFDGVPTDADVERLSKNVPYQEAGRVSGSELTLSRANRSVRLWEHVVDRLSNGQQPDKAQCDAVGYLMRTTAVYGSGKFGAADRQAIAQRRECKSPFQVEMLTVYLIRTFVRDLVQHTADVRGGDESVLLNKALARSLGIGNSTGLGMAPFILNHPALFNNWIIAREEALAQVRSIVKASAEEVALFQSLFVRAHGSMQQWVTQHELQKEKTAELLIDLDFLATYLDSVDFQDDYIWDAVYQWTEQNLNSEAQELMVSLLLEPYGELVDGFVHCMGSDQPLVSPIDGSMKLHELQAQAESLYQWASPIDWTDKATRARAWYVSEEKLEPRLGERFDEPIEHYEQPLSPARDAMLMLKTVSNYTKTENFTTDNSTSVNTASSYNPISTVAEFLLKHPEHRHSVRRIQALKNLPYGEIQDNTIGADLLPIDMLRCKLSFFGAIHFDPRSDRWVRIRMFGNAPYPEELAEQDADFWAYPE